MTGDLLRQLLVDFFLLLKLFLRYRSQVGQAANFNLIAHILSIASRKHLDSFHKLIVDADLVFQRSSIAIVQHVDLLCLVLQIDF